MKQSIDKERYARQLLIPEIGETGQLKLQSASVLVIGAGGLGSPVLTYLAAAGIGHLTIVDADTINLSNLNRQFLHDTADIGQQKATSAQVKLSRLNPDIDIVPLVQSVSPENVDQLVAPFDLVIDCVDNLTTRHCVNAACIRLGKPLVEAGVAGFMGFVMTYLPGQGPCYGCLNPGIDMSRISKTPPAVLGATAGIAGTIQAAEAIKVLLGMPNTLTGQVLFFDAQTMNFEKFTLSQNPDCPLCGRTS